MVSKSTTQAVLAVMLLLLGIGCSKEPKKYKVTGTVRFEGRPVEKGEILLTAGDKSVSPDVGRIENGEYTLMATPGVKRVEIRASRAVQQTAMGPLMKEYIPHHYNGPTTTLREEVQPVELNRFDFELAKTVKKTR